MVKSDSGTRGGAVSLDALPNRSTTNSLGKTFTTESPDGVKSAQLLLYAALRDATTADDFPTVGGTFLVPAYSIHMQLSASISPDSSLACVNQQQPHS